MSQKNSLDELFGDFHKGKPLTEEEKFQMELDSTFDYIMDVIDLDVDKYIKINNLYDSRDLDSLKEIEERLIDSMDAKVGSYNEQDIKDLHLDQDEW